jgi:hypothetical protein
LVLVLTLLAACDGASSFDTAAGQQSPPPPTNGGDGSIVPGSGEHGGNGGNGGGLSAVSQNPAPAPELDGGQPIPEPTTFLLLGSGLAAAACYRRRKNRAKVETLS